MLLLLLDLPPESSGTNKSTLGVVKELRYFFFLDLCVSFFSSIFFPFIFFPFFFLAGATRLTLRLESAIETLQSQRLNNNNTTTSSSPLASFITKTPKDVLKTPGRVTEYPTPPSSLATSPETARRVCILLFLSFFPFSSCSLSLYFNKTNLLSFLSFSHLP